MLRRTLILAVCALAVRSAGAFDFEALKTLVEGEDIRSVEKLVERLPGEFFVPGRFALAYESRGRQGARGDAPRVLLFTEDATTVMAYTGADVKGGDSFEVLQWRPPHRWEMRYVHFQPGVKAFISEKNPEECADCHGQENPRPNWDSYPLWPGFYAHEHQVFAPPREKTFWAEFKKVQAGHARYGRLQIPWRDTDEGRPPFELDRGFSRLTFQFAKLNQRRIAGLLNAMAGMKRLRYAVLGAVGGCREIESWFPQEIARVVKAAREAEAASLADVFADEHEKKILRHIGKDAEAARAEEKATGKMNLSKGRHDENNLPYLASVRAVLSLVPASTEPWSTARTERNTAFHNGIGATFWFRPSLYSDPEYLSQYPGLYSVLVEELRVRNAYVELSRRDFTYRDRKVTGRDVRPNCEALKAASLRALRKLK